MCRHFPAISSISVGQRVWRELCILVCVCACWQGILIDGHVFDDRPCLSHPKLPPNCSSLS
uniref:Uncharacterized protein n=1 Tax=Daphnia magna TaxID=35525 RepID=A0A0P6JSS7_9CRUS